MLKSKHIFSVIIHTICLALLFKAQVKGEVLFLKTKTSTHMNCISFPQKLCLDQTGSAICIEIGSSNIALAMKQI